MKPRVIWIAIAALSLALPAQGQLQRSAIQAEPFRHQVRMDAGAELPAAGSLLGTFEILEATAGTTPGTAQLLLVAYDTGTAMLPVTLPADSTNLQPIQVLPPPADSIKDYTPPKEWMRDTAGKKDKHRLWPWILVVSTLAALLYYLMQRRNNQQEMPAWQGADGLAILQQVKKAWQAGSLTSIALGEGLVDSLRAALGMHARRSTRQFLKAIQKRQPALADAELAAILDWTDGWRFGKKEAEPGAGDRAIAALENLFEQLGQKAGPIS